MSPNTRSSRITFSHIDPGPEPSYEQDSDSSDVEMIMEADAENAEDVGVETHETDEEAEMQDIESDETLKTGAEKLQDDRDDNVMKNDPVSDIKEPRIIIAIDFGTTFSSVAYTILPMGLSPDQVRLRDLKCIGNYPGYEPAPGTQDHRQDVPTELWYDDFSVDGNDNAQHPEDDGSDSSSSDEDESEREDSHFEDDENLQERTSQQQRRPRVARAEQYWGYQVQQQLNMKNIPRDEARPLARFKLNLDNSSETQTVRDDVRPILKALIRKKVIQKETDIYVHYLTHLLRHTKDQLLANNELKDDMLIQFVLCVPAKWPMNACRIMQSALEKAVLEVKMNRRADDSVRNLFMISEPEAAAECILGEARSELYAGETVVILDAGGGTVDAVTYSCSHGDPLRLSAEVVAPDCKLKGASFINEEFEKKLLDKLANETYLFNNGKTLRSIVQAKTTVFENHQKRLIDITRKHALIAPIQVEYLRKNTVKRFENNFLKLRRKTMEKFFLPSLEGVKHVLKNQLDLAESKGYRIEKVILTGGFGQSPSLQSYLRNYLEGRKNIQGWDIELIVPQNPSTAVARGAVLRALNKRFGPSRITQCSYGFLMSEPYDPEEIEAHRLTKCRINKDDGEKYVDNTIRWVIRTGDRVENMQTFSHDVKHTFALGRKRLLCAEQLWMSDTWHENHYRKSHGANKGAEMVGSIEADLTYLKDEGLIEPQIPADYNTRAGPPKKYWEAHIEVAMIVEARSIRFEARYPQKEFLKPGEKQRVLAMRLVGMAASFKPGTA